MKLILFILVLGALIGTGLYYRTPIQQKIAGTQQVSLASPLAVYSTPTPTAVATPVPTSSPTPVPTATATPLGSIAILGTNGHLPTSGPELNLALTGGIALVGGAGARYWKLKRNLKKSWKNIDIS